MEKRKVQEKIFHAPHDRWKWQCLCGNMSNKHGFFPCDAEGNEVRERTIDNWFNGLLACQACSRIIDPDTLEVVGYSSSSPINSPPSTPIDRIRILILYGKKAETFDSSLEAARYLQASSDEKTAHLKKVEIKITLTSGKMIERTFKSKYLAILFIEKGISSMPELQ